VFHVVELAGASSGVINEWAPVSLVGERVTSIEVLAKEISNDLASMSVNASEGVLHMAMQVGDAIVVLRISRNLKAWESSSSLFASGSLFLVACVN